MERMYAPWRLAFLKGEEQARDVIPVPTGCIFCDYVVPLGQPVPDGTSRRAWDRRRLVVTVRPHAFVILNRYPYNNGHLMVVPHAHQDGPDRLDDAAFVALQALLKESVAALRESYRCDGLNIGMNIGAAGGAGIAPHCHWHAVPRWHGDNNFMPVFSDTKVINEALDDTWERLAALLRRPEDDA